MLTPSHVETVTGPIAVSRKRVLRIALFGHFGSGNLGNEGSLAAVLAFVKKAVPGAELSCICVETDAVRKEHGLPSFSLNTRARHSVFASLDRVLLRLPSGIADVIRTLWLARK